MKECTCRNEPANHKCQKCNQWFCKNCIQDHRLICGVKVITKRRPHLIRDVHCLATEQVHALLWLARNEGNNKARIEHIAERFEYPEKGIHNIISGAKSEKIEVYIISLIEPFLWARNSTALLNSYRAQKKFNQQLTRRRRKAKRALL